MNNPTNTNVPLMCSPVAFGTLDIERAWKTPDGKFLVVATKEFSAGPVVAVFGAQTRQPVIGFMPPVNEALDIAMTRDGRYLAMGLGVYDGGAMWDGNLLIWDIQENRAWQVFTDIPGVMGCAFDPDTDVLTLLITPYLDFDTRDLGYQVVLQPAEWQSTGLRYRTLPGFERLTDQHLDDEFKKLIAGRDYAYHLIDAYRSRLPRMEEVDTNNLSLPQNKEHS